MGCLPPTELPTAYSLATGWWPTGCPTTNRLEIHTSDIGWAEVDLSAANPLAAHTLVKIVVPAAELPVTSHQAIALANAIRIPLCRRLTHSLRIKPVYLALYAAYSLPAHISLAAGLPDIRSLQA